jgi:anthraniloyl-CoA monooxygenase
VRLPNRIATLAPVCHAERAETHDADDWNNGAGLLLTPTLAISAEGRIAPGSAGLYATEQAEMWAQLAQRVHATGAALGVTLNHAGRRGATQPPTSDGQLPDRPLRAGAWPLVSASPIPYTSRSQTPRELTLDAMEAITSDFVAAARRANDCGFDLLTLHMAHGYLLASFLSPLSNQRQDDYGGALEQRMRFPLEVFAAVRAVWPASKPLAVALTCHDGVTGGLTLDDAVTVAQALKARGCDLIQPLAGQTTPDATLPWGKGFLTPLSERIRTEVGVATLASGYLTTINDANTILAGGRADLALMTPLHTATAKG